MQKTYFFRRLDAVVGQETIEVDEAGLLKCPMPLIVLGEPGMGKTEFIGELGRKLGATPITASLFAHSRTPAHYISEGKPLLIDGLDEAMARNDNDVIDMISARLEEAGAPNFVLCCRSRQWESRATDSFHRIYGRAPTIATLKPFTREEASRYLTERFDGFDQKALLDQLDENGLGEFYSIPLLLEFVGKIAAGGQKIPDVRAELFGFACGLMWQEHDDTRSRSKLVAMTEEQALDAAGAIAAALILGGAEVISELSPFKIEGGEIRLQDVAQHLPGAHAAEAVISSKLFVSVGAGKSKPIHRTIAEFLAARWLGRQARSPRVQRRLLTIFHGHGAVAASHQGLHAWLAYHSPEMAKPVIEADPFGVLRQGDVAALGGARAKVLLEALVRLAQVDPYFRSQDWRARPARGLMIPSLKGRIKEIIESAQSNEHLRSLLIESMEGSPLALELASTLEIVLLDCVRFYRERDAAADALWPHRDLRWWQGTVEELRCQGSEDATRLARELIEKLELQVSDDQLVSTIFAEEGYTISPFPKRIERTVHSIHFYDSIARNLTGSRLGTVLDRISAYSELIDQGDWREVTDLERFSAHLMVRALEARIVGPLDAPRLWSWLGIFNRYRSHYRDDLKELIAILNKDVDSRRAVHSYVVWEARPEASLFATMFQLQRRFVGIVDQRGDVGALLETLIAADNTVESNRQDWRDLMLLSRCEGGLDPALKELGQRFVRGDKELEAVLHQLENPKRQEWEIEQEEGEKARKVSREKQYREAREYYLVGINELRAGHIGMALRPAKAFLGLFHNLKSDGSGEGRLVAWLGQEIAEAAVDGFEAALHLPDLPSPEKISEGYANGREWHASFVVMAGIFARLQKGVPLSDLPLPVLQTGLLLSLSRCGLTSDHNANEALQQLLKPLVVSSEEDREAFARVWVEPQLVAGSAHVSGLYQLANEEPWKETGAKLFPEWLGLFSDVPEAIETQLIDGLIATGNLVALSDHAETKLNGVYKNFDHLFLWLSVDVLVRFEATETALKGIGNTFPEFIWAVRSRFKGDGDRSMQTARPEQAAWIVSEFRAHWPNVERVGGSDRDQNLEDAAEFLRALILQIAEDTSEQGIAAMTALRDAPSDTYSRFILHIASEQRQKRAEAAIEPLAPVQLAQILEDRAPANIDDLKAMVLEALWTVGKKLRGDDLDQIRDFWEDGWRKPYDENRCRDRLAVMLKFELERYDIRLIPEADYPQTKRADLAFANGKMQLPLEAKGQWHDQVWDAATGQLEASYLSDWQCEGRGIYIVFWFGDLPGNTHRRLKNPPEGIPRPATSEEMRLSLIAQIPEGQRPMIEVVVLDISKPKNTG